MLISSSNNTNFCGLWEPVKRIRKEQGFNNFNKTVYTLHDFVYHPWADESYHEIMDTVNKYFFGRSYSVWDKYEGKRKYNIVEMNNIKKGEVIDKKDAKKYYEMGYKDTFEGGIEEDEVFLASCSNTVYEVYDIKKMFPDSIGRIVAKIFGTNK